MNDEQRRRELSDFLRTRRDRLTPADVGLPNGDRRRTLGLRREEVAMLANVSTTWYTFLEQGRNIRVSEQVLENIAAALQLASEERTHLFMLALQQPPPEKPVQLEVVSSTLQLVLDRFDAVGPAYITGSRWDILAWNQSACILFGDFNAMSNRERNFIWFFFTNEVHRLMLIDWENHAQFIVSKFRSITSRYLGDEKLTELIEDLQRVSPEFREWWSHHDVYARNEGRKEYKHPTVGRLVFEYTVFQPEGSLDLRLVMYTPLPEADTPEKFQRLKLIG